MVDNGNHEKQLPSDTERPTAGNARIATTNQARTVIIDGELVSATILSVGVVGALLLFIHESFTHPTEANIVVPLLLTPLAQAVVAILNKRKAKRAPCPNCNETE